MQRALMQYKDPKKLQAWCEALILAGREDLIGYGPECLIRPPRGAGGIGKKARCPEKEHKQKSSPSKKNPAKRGRR